MRRIRVGACGSHEDELLTYGLHHTSHTIEWNNACTLLMIKGKSHFSSLGENRRTTCVKK